MSAGYFQPSPSAHKSWAVCLETGRMYEITKTCSASPGNHANKRRANEQHVESGEKKQQLHPYIITCAQVMIGLQFLLNMSVNFF